LCAALTDEADGRLFISGRITVHGRNGTGILIEDKAYQIRRCRS
jgi:hypothetical protein